MDYSILEYGSFITAKPVELNGIDSRYTVETSESKEGDEKSAAVEKAEPLTAEAKGHGLLAAAEKLRLQSSTPDTDSQQGFKQSLVLNHPHESPTLDAERRGRVFS